MPRSQADLLRDLASITETFTSMLAQIEWAADEITAAQARHPELADVLHHSFDLIKPTQDLMAREDLYRAHVRELLERLAVGESTKSGTSVEVLGSLVHASLVTPLNAGAFALYRRMWRRIGLPEIEAIAESDDHYEAISGAHADQLEADARRALARRDRVLLLPTCNGIHLHQAVRCRFAAARTAA